MRMRMRMRMQCILFGDRRLDRDPGSSEPEHRRRRFCPRWLHSYLSQRQPFKLPCGCLWTCFSERLLAIFFDHLNGFKGILQCTIVVKHFKQILFRLLSHHWKPFKTTGISPWTPVAHKIMGVDLRLTWRKGHSHLLPSAWWSISREILELAARTLFGRTKVPHSISCLVHRPAYF